MSQAATTGRPGDALQVERRTIDFVPPEERHGRPASLFTVWFAANTQVTTAVTGALAVVVGLSLPWAVLALVVGNLVGGVAMALHSAQGPKLGVPQMIQSRAQFGFFGAVLPLVLVILMYLGFFASSGVLGGSALSEWTGLPAVPAIIVVAIVCTVLAIYGYRLIHRYERWVSLLSALAFLYLSVELFRQHDVGAAWHAGHLSWGTFGLVVSIAATWQFTWGPYVADYSRYLPASTSTRSTFWWTYGGAIIGACWVMCFGAAAAAVAQKAFEGGQVQFLAGMAAHGVGWLVLLIIILGVIAVNVLNLYGAFMSTTTTLTVVWRGPLAPSTRTAYVVGAAVVGTAIAIAGRGDFLANYTNFILFLSYFLIPWSAINLVDFYWVRKERYDIAALFDPRLGYGMFNVRALTAYVIGIVLQLPFMNTTFYVGWWVDDLGGADIAWLIGFVVPALAYYVLLRDQRIRPDDARERLS
ncbi:purine-cytosine permease family protein [Nocardioides terrisoli]|uniref:purine-cytosine permease family protein n=1 Tax=Nocardioides terrisoli TaxID=3388267 RepID=UPI00287B7E09|nr:cytosine permease [Nocardioides marmorisolisilvae]